MAIDALMSSIPFPVQSYSRGKQTRLIWRQGESKGALTNVSSFIFTTILLGHEPVTGEGTEAQEGTKQDIAELLDSV